MSIGGHATAASLRRPPWPSHSSDTVRSALSLRLPSGERLLAAAALVLGVWILLAALGGGPARADTSQPDQAAAGVEHGQEAEPPAELPLAATGSTEGQTPFSSRADGAVGQTGEAVPAHPPPSGIDEPTAGSMEPGTQGSTADSPMTAPHLLGTGPEAPGGPGDDMQATAQGDVAHSDPGTAVQAVAAPAGLPDVSAETSGAVTGKPGIATNMTAGVPPDGDVTGNLDMGSPVNDHVAPDAVPDVRAPVDVLVDPATDSVVNDTESAPSGGSPVVSLNVQTHEVEDITVTRDTVASVDSLIDVDVQPPAGTSENPGAAVSPAPREAAPLVTGVAVEPSNPVVALPDTGVDAVVAAIVTDPSEAGVPDGAPPGPSSRSAPDVPLTETWAIAVPAVLDAEERAFAPGSDPAVMQPREGAVPDALAPTEIWLPVDVRALDVGAPAAAFDFIETSARLAQGPAPTCSFLTRPGTGRNRPASGVDRSAEPLAGGSLRGFHDGAPAVVSTPGLPLRPDKPLPAPVPLGLPVAPAPAAPAGSSGVAASGQTSCGSAHTEHRDAGPAVIGGEPAASLAPTSVPIGSGCEGAVVGRAGDPAARPD